MGAGDFCEVLRAIRIETACTRERFDHRIKTLDDRDGIEFHMCRFDQR